MRTTLTREDYAKFLNTKNILIDKEVSLYLRLIAEGKRPDLIFKSGERLVGLTRLVCGMTPIKARACAMFYAMRVSEKGEA